AAPLYERLRAIAPVRLVDVDGAPLAPADLAAPAGPPALDTAQFAARTDSSRVLLQGNVIGFTVGDCGGGRTPSRAARSATARSSNRRQSSSTPPWGRCAGWIRSRPSWARRPRRTSRTRGAA